MFKSISIDELKNLKNGVIIDIRSNEKYNNNHITNAINIPIKDLLTNPNKYLNSSNIYYIYCQRGVQSKKLCQILATNNFNVVNISGGYEAWILNQ